MYTFIDTIFTVFKLFIFYTKPFQNGSVDDKQSDIFRFVVGGRISELSTIFFSLLTRIQINFPGLLNVCVIFEIGGHVRFFVGTYG